MRTWCKKLVRKAVNLAGYDIQKSKGRDFAGGCEPDQRLEMPGIDRIQYACGPKFLTGWLNVDAYPPEVMKKRYAMPPECSYFQVDLSCRQPFPDNSFSLAFAEDFIEHLSQQESIIFLSECLRVLKKGGVLRLSFPGLEGVLQRHFSSAEHHLLLKGAHDAYHHFKHVHFYCREELELVARCLRFSRIQFTAFGCSDHKELQCLETRDRQQDLNIYAELTK